VFGPTGIGVLYGRAALLEMLPPYQAGGGMIQSVGFDRTVYADVPARFEAGTPDIAGAVALGSAIEYLSATGLDQVAAHESSLSAMRLRPSRAFLACESSASPAREPRFSRSSSMACTHMTSARCSIAKELRSAPATTAVSR
jgi:selenocysteine lyase/cysteine desulfurase